MFIFAEKSTNKTGNAILRAMIFLSFEVRREKWNLGCIVRSGSIATSTRYFSIGCWCPRNHVHRGVSKVFFIVCRDIALCRIRSIRLCLDNVFINSMSTCWSSQFNVNKQNRPEAHSRRQHYSIDHSHVNHRERPFAFLLIGNAKRNKGRIAMAIPVQRRFQFDSTERIFSVHLNRSIDRCCSSFSFSWTVNIDKWFEQWNLPIMIIVVDALEDLLFPLSLSHFNR